jgi:hypothetical protein
MIHRILHFVLCLSFESRSCRNVYSVLHSVILINNVSNPAHHHRKHCVLREVIGVYSDNPNEP